LLFVEEETIPPPVELADEVIGDGSLDKRLSNLKGDFDRVLSLFVILFNSEDFCLEPLFPPL
jgi:hypothetical protein